LTTKRLALKVCLFPAENLFPENTLFPSCQRWALDFSQKATPKNRWEAAQHCTVRRGLESHDVTFILVVEDSEDNREILRYVLRASGYGVLEAANGEQAVKICRDRHPDLVLMDLSMPVLDGYGAAQQIRQLEELQDIPIIAVSAHATVDYRAKALAGGFNDYLTKPIDFAQLETVLHRYLNAGA
jgi:CheY-like chemotaxis protein